MKNTLIITILLIAFALPAYSLGQDAPDQTIKDLSLMEVAQNPDRYINRVITLYGVIASVKVEEGGTTLELVNLEISKNSKLEMDKYAARFLVFIPAKGPAYDSIIYKIRDVVTVIGRFQTMRTGQIEKMEYKYPLFEAVDIHPLNQPQTAVNSPQNVGQNPQIPNPQINNNYYKTVVYPDPQPYPYPYYYPYPYPYPAPYPYPYTVIRVHMGRHHRY